MKSYLMFAGKVVLVVVVVNLIFKYLGSSVPGLTTIRNFWDDDGSQGA